MKFSNVTLETDLALLSDVGGDCVPKSWVENRDVADIQISGSWTWYKQDDIKVSNITNLTVELENGFKAQFAGHWKWISSDNKYKPTSCDGNFGNIIPSSNDTFSNISVFSIVTSNQSYNQNIKISNDGLKVVSGRVVKDIGGEIKKTAYASVTFKGRYYFGYSSSNDITEDIIKRLTKSGLCTSRSLTVTDVTAAESYTVYAYPSSYNELTSIIQDGTYNITEAFTKKTENVNVTNSAGNTISYIVYVSNNKGAFTNNKLQFS